MKHKFTIIAVIIFIILSWQLEAATPPIPEQPSNYVMDLAGIIDPQTEADLNRQLKDLEDRTTAQMVVLTLNTLEGEPIEQVSLRTAERWALGQKGKDNGVLITVAVQDRKYRIEVGYGLEAILPDSLVGTIGRDCFVPNFRMGKYSEGISDAVKIITGQIIGEPIQIKKESWRERVTELIYWLLLIPGLIYWLLLVFGGQVIVLSWLQIKRNKNFDMRTYWLILVLCCIAFYPPMSEMLFGIVETVIFNIVLLVLIVLGFMEMCFGGTEETAFFSGGGGFGGGGGGFGGGGGGGFGGGGCSGGW